MKLKGKQVSIDQLNEATGDINLGDDLNTVISKLRAEIISLNSWQNTIYHIDPNPLPKTPWIYAKQSVVEFSEGEFNPLLAFAFGGVLGETVASDEYYLSINSNGTIFRSLLQQGIT